MKFKNIENVNGSNFLVTMIGCSGDDKVHAVDSNEDVVIATSAAVTEI